jgi:hypothetical protein
VARSASGSPLKNSFSALTPTIVDKKCKQVAIYANDEIVEMISPIIARSDNLWINQVNRQRNGYRCETSTPVI